MYFRKFVFYKGVAFKKSIPASLFTYFEKFHRSCTPKTYTLDSVYFTFASEVPLDYTLGVCSNIEKAAFYRDHIYLCKTVDAFNKI